MESPAALPARLSGALSAASPARAHSALVVPLFAATMFLSAFLLFLVEPMAAKMVLPILGGSPMVWNACVVFFQVSMVAGYGYAYGASRWLPLRAQVMTHGTLLLLPLLVLPFTMQGSGAPPSGNPALWLFGLLSVTIGIPFFALSTSASVFQHWLSRTDHPHARDPYFLYASSNLGSLLALGCYPVLVEPVFTLRQQSKLWATGYIEFVVLAGACAAVAWWRTAPPPASASPDARAGEETSAAVTTVRRVRWVALAFIPSSLLLAVTSHISTDIAAVPLLWVLPLALYLLTFVLAFGRRSAAAGAFARRAFPLAVVPLALFTSAGVRGPLTLILPLHLLAFFVTALLCHADLAQDRPGASRLTEFYFWISFGGMLGGLFNALAAPLLFNSIAEYPLVLALACVLLSRNGATPARRPAWAAFVLPAGIALVTAAALLTLEGRLAWLLAVLSVPALAAFTQRRSRAFGTTMAALIAAGFVFGNADERVLFATRTFFGVYRVSEDSGHRYHALAHGTTLHGLQALAPERSHEALTYFHQTGPFGQAFRALPRAMAGRDIGVVGLGIGTLASYAGPDQRWTFFEIDPAIERIARDRSMFSFMDACGARCRVVIGDARLSLNRVPERAYDLLVIDAFSSDSIPMHLMTREAYSLYLSRLAPGAALLVHISNRHLLLGPEVASLAASQHLYALQQIDRRKDGWPEGKTESHWVVMARNQADLGSLVTDPRWSRLQASPDVKVWSDDFSNILSVLSFR